MNRGMFEGGGPGGREGGPDGGGTEGGGPEGPAFGGPNPIGGGIGGGNIGGMCPGGSKPGRLGGIGGGGSDTPEGADTAGFKGGGPSKRLAGSTMGLSSSAVVAEAASTTAADG